MTVFTAISTIASAQIDFFVVDKLVTYVQTSSSTPSLHATSPFIFSFEIEGQNPGTSIGSITNHAFTSPGGSGVTGYTLVSGDYDSSENQWKYRQSFALKSDLDAAFSNGTYSVSVGNVADIPLTLNASPSGDLYPLVPKVTGMNNGASWNGSNQLLISDTGTTTLTFSDFTSQYNSTSNGQVGAHIGAFLYLTSSGSFTELNQEALTFEADSAFNTFMISGLTAGSTYQFELEYNAIMAADTTSIPGATGVALFSSRMQLEVLAIPEPSTYAAILGALALGGVMVQRRRRAISV